ncbi:MAG TPA: ABC transporter permease [Stellaceae bacterium]|jgi:simple sugar transport system permease protein|nr:ABC transporter permease [Stellaceae bacterium]
MAEDMAVELAAPATSSPTIERAHQALVVGRAAEAFLIPLGALVGSLILFGIFVAIAGVNPFAVYQAMAVGSVGSWFSIQNTLTLSAPLILTALCTALPAQAGLMIIGGEGAFVMGGVAAVAAGLPLAGHHFPGLTVQTVMAIAALAAGAAWIAMAGGLRHRRGVNETISTLLLTYIAIAFLNQLVEGVMRDPSSLNKPSSYPLPDAAMIGDIPGTDVHWGLVLGILFCVFAYVLMFHTTFGFAARMVGGNTRAARLAGLPVGRIILIVSGLGGAAAGLAGMIEVAAVQGRASATLAAGYGFTGILVAFIARQNPLAVIPVAILFGGINASGGLLQRRLDLPDASVLVLQGIIFVVILASETLFGRFRIFRPKER